MIHRFASAIVVFAFFGVAALAGTKREVIIAGQPFPDTLVLLVDTSGSMGCYDRKPYKRAMREVGLIARQMTDAGKIRFYVFDDVLTEEPHGWIVLPDAEKVEAALLWLRARKCDGGTNLADAMDVVLALPESPLGVIVVTDCQPDGGTDSTAEEIAVANRKRKTPAIIGVTAIGPDEKGNRFGILVAEWSGGAYVRIVESGGKLK